jgi:hypothetical protein
MTTLHVWIAAYAAVLFVASGCGNSGKVEQGRVIAYDRTTQTVTLIAEPPSAAEIGVLPPITIRTPVDPEEMGPAPAAGKLIRLDPKERRIVLFDAAAQAFRIIEYTPVAEHRKVNKAPASPLVDRDRKTITVYSPEQHLIVTFAASSDLLAMPAETWRFGDVVRYYFKEPDRALRLMNVSKTDLSKSGG